MKPFSRISAAAAASQFYGQPAITVDNQNTSWSAIVYKAKIPVSSQYCIIADDMFKITA